MAYGNEKPLPLGLSRRLVPFNAKVSPCATSCARTEIRSDAGGTRLVECAANRVAGKRGTHLQRGAAEHGARLERAAQLCLAAKARVVRASTV